ncbi:MAG: hypothetical protein IAE87_02935 [Rhodobacteraceae bacterium]|jgi:hypothetical protein|nr:hypothetical protein [Paracoccaceae bacterium]
MLRQTFESLLFFVALVREIPPFPLRVLLPGAVVLIIYPFLSVALGSGEEGAAFVTAFLMGLALRVALRFSGMLRMLLHRFARRETAATAVLVAMGPLLLLATVGDPLWCQRSQSAYYIILGSMFVSDMLANRTDMAARFWPWPAMRRVLPTLTRAMVLYNLGFLVLNEAVIYTARPSVWLIYWAVLPILSHVVLSLLILTVVSLDDSD